MITVRDAGLLFGMTWLPHQVKAFTEWEELTAAGETKACIYYPTGKGKTKIMLTMLAVIGVKEVVVITPPLTQPTWIADGKTLGIKVTPMSHAKFRMKDTLLSRNVAVIVDEFHMLGGHTGKGWTKLDRLAAGLKAPLLLGSATPNYNDAERVYCIAHVLHPLDNRGGFQGWLFQHCQVLASPYSSIPDVLGFHQYKSAEDFLAHMKGVIYVPDDAPDILIDIPMLDVVLPEDFEDYNVDRSRERIMSSIIEKKHRKRYLQIVDPATGRLREHIYEMLITLAGNATTPIIIYVDHAEIAKAAALSLQDWNVDFAYVDGTVTKTVKRHRVDQFLNGEKDVLIGTASLATGTDGLDKMCNEMVILDDTNDASLRRQLVGRILPRGDVKPEDYIGKYAHRFIYNED